MPTQRLIDINTAAITYRRECLTALSKHLYTDCVGAIITLNAMLPADDGEHKYRIIFDDDEYNTKIKEHFIIVCPLCETEHQYDHVSFYELEQSFKERTIFDIQNDRFWKCPKCKKQNRLKESTVIQSSIQKPYYLRVVPNPPIKTNDLIQKLHFHKKMNDWVWVCLNALEDGFARFRDDNWNKQDEYSDLDIDTSFEENDK